MLKSQLRAALFLVFVVLSCVDISARPAWNQPAATDQPGAIPVSAPAPDSADFPPYDAEAFRLQAEGVVRKATTLRLSQHPDDPDVIRDLLDQGRLEEALVVLRTIVTSLPERMPSAFEAMYGQGARFSSRAHGHADALQEVVNAAKQRLPRLPREDAARVARQLLLVDRQSSCSSNETGKVLACFLAEYAGTETALLTQVDYIAFQGRPLAERLAALDALVRDHPGTVVAAKALAQKAFQLSSVNVYVGQPSLESREADPTDRLLQVLDIVKELESGRYPPCEWISQASRFVPGFFTEQATFAPKNLDRLIDAYFGFVVTHFTLDALHPARFGVGGIVSTTIPRLLQRKGDSGNIDAFLTRLEQQVPDPASARYLRASIYVESLNAERPGDRPELFRKAVAALAALHAEGDGALNRKALAMLGSLYFWERDYTHARHAYVEYLRLYPRSTWAWVAALRIGQCEEALDHWRAAAEAYSAAATGYASVPFARVLGHAYAGQMFEHVNQFDRVLIEQRRALAGWDADYGQTYTLFERHRRSADDEPAAPSTRTVVRQNVADRITRLEQSLRRPNGVLVERGRWLVEHESFHEALKTLAAVLARAGSNPVVSDARYWQHRARVAIAGQLAAAENPARDAAKALAELESVGHDVYDFGVFMADIARASVLWQEASSTAADRAMQAAMDRWENSQRHAREQPQTGVARDVAAIRDLILRPQTSSVLGNFARNVLDPQRRTPAFLLIADPDMQVRAPDGTVTRVTVYQQISGTEHVLFLTAEQRAALSGVVTTLDGRQNQRRADGTARAEQPGSRRTLEVRAFWNRFFPTGDWQQTPGETGPAIREIEFLDTERTKAAARIQAANEGATVMLEKTDGIWRVIELVDSWIA